MTHLGRTLAIAAAALGLMAPPALAQTGAVSGNVTAQAGGAALENICVEAIDEVGFPVQSDVTDASGDYEMTDVPAGNVKVKFKPCPVQNYAPEWFDNKATEALADLVPVNDGETTGSVDAALAAGATISGTVTGDSGTPGPVESICVSAASTTSGLDGAFTQTDASGDYTLEGLATASYKIQFSPCGGENLLGEFYDDEVSFETADPVAATAGSSVTGIDAELTTGGSVSGTLLGSDGLAKVGACVYVTTTGSQPTFYPGSTDANGDYLVDGLPGGDYKIQFDPSCSPANVDLGEWYDNKSDMESADLVNVASGATTSGIDAQLAEGATISGTVIDASTTDPVAGICVNVLRVSDDLSIGVATTDVNGDYSIGALQAGSYKVQFGGPSCVGFNLYAPEFHQNKRTVAAADTVVLATGATQDVDAALDEGGTISGTVIDGLLSTGVASVCVVVLDAATGNDTGYLAFTQGDGTYSIGGLPAGSYKVRFDGSCSGQDYPERYYLNQQSLDNADPVAVTLGTETSGIDATFVPPPTVAIDSGTGPTNDSTPSFGFTTQNAASVQCSVDQGTPAFSACTPGSGAHTVASPLVDGTYTFRVRVTNAEGTATETGQFTVDTVAPDVTINPGGAGVLTNDTTPTIGFTASGLGVGGNVGCKWQPAGPLDPDMDGCATPTTDTPFNPLVPDGPYIFRVRARDAAGNESAERQRFFTVDTVPPTVSVTSGPTGAIDDTTPTFGFAAEDGAIVACSVDAGTPAFGDCSGATEHTPAALAPGAYTFRVRANDQAGNQVIDTRSFSVNAPPGGGGVPPDVTPPPLKLNSGPKAKTRDRTPTFRFSSTEAGTTFRCKVDRKAEARCASPFTLKKLRFGKHKFTLVAVDQAGNRSQPVIKRFTVKRKPRRQAP
jgi:Carboxypeptidase regulatory-like domain/Bacterial Ig-like domain